MKLAELERHLRHQGCVLYREGGAHSIGSTPPCTRSPASRAIAKSKKGRFGPSANNLKFRGSKAVTQVEKRYLGHPAGADIQRTA
jgi:hypothetical protein